MVDIVAKVFYMAQPVPPKRESTLSMNKFQKFEKFLNEFNFPSLNKLCF
jgi:hypothetical protein